MALPLHPPTEQIKEHHQENNLTTEEEETKSNDNPLPVETKKSPCTPTISSTQITAMISNLSTSYNTTNISLTLPILHYLLQTPVEEREEHDGVIASSLLGGMACGQILGGTLGDVIGRKKALALVICLQMAASIGSACIPQSMGAVETTLVVWRFVLGVGAGGVYPLAAVMSAEDTTTSSDDVAASSSPEEEKEQQMKKLRSVALTFSTQGIGFLLVPLITFILLVICKEENLYVVWRTLLALGALPGLVLFGMLLSTQCKKQKSKIGYFNQGNNDQSNHQEEENGEQCNNGNQHVSSLELGIDHHDKERQFHEPLMSHSYLYDEQEQHQQQQEKWNENEDGLSFHTAQQQHHDPLSINPSTETSAAAESSSTASESKKGLWQAIKSEPHLKRKLCGTAGTWFLFDVLFYGNTLFQPIVLEAAFGSAHHKDGNDEEQFHLLLETARDALILSLLALPGYFVSAMVVGRYTSLCCNTSVGRQKEEKKKCCTIHQTPKYIQTQGFFFMCVLYVIIGSLWDELRSIQALLILLYGGTFFFANYGPNATTFMLPSITYSHTCRSTLNGLSAAAGKVGALFGTMVFEPAAEKWGDDVVMLICAAVSVLALILTRVCIVEDESSINVGSGGSWSGSFSLLDGEHEEEGGDHNNADHVLT